MRAERIGGRLLRARETPRARCGKRAHSAESPCGAFVSTGAPTGCGRGDDFDRWRRSEFPIKSQAVKPPAQSWRYTPPRMRLRSISLTISRPVQSYAARPRAQRNIANKMPSRPLKGREGAQTSRGSTHVPRQVAGIPLGPRHLARSAPDNGGNRDHLLAAPSAHSIVVRAGGTLTLLIPHVALSRWPRISVGGSVRHVPRVA